MLRNLFSLINNEDARVFFFPFETSINIEILEGFFISEIYTVSKINNKLIMKEKVN